MCKEICSFSNCKYRSKNHEAEYFIYINNTDIENSRSNKSDVYIPQKGKIDFHLLRYAEPSEHSRVDYIEFINQIDFYNLYKLHQSDYTKVYFCQFHAPIESSFVKDKSKTKKDIFQDASLLASFNKSIHDDIDEWHLYNQKLLEKISATDDDSEKIRISREFRSLYLNAVCFPGDIDFSHHGDLCKKRYSMNFELSKCRFEAKATFRQVSFDTLICDKTYFRGRVDFSGCKFRVGASFKDCIFYESAILRGEYSGNPVYFDRTIFKKDADFWWSTFKNQVWFEDSIFEGEAGFIQATFAGDAIFKRTCFHSTTEFSETKFERFANFDESVFKGWTSFKNSKFATSASYENCSFETCDFMNAKFDGQLVFEKSLFNSDAFFDYVDDISYWNDGRNEDPGKNFRYVSFKGAHFFKRASFKNRIFLHITSFRDTIFDKAPEFYNSVFHQGTSFSGAKFLDVESNWAEMSYRTLKVAAESLNAKREEDLFFSLEQRSILHQYVYKKLLGRVKELWEIAANPFALESNSIKTSNRQLYYTSDPAWIDLFLSFLYQLFSNYGRSIVLNLAWIIILILMCSGFYFYCFHIGNSFGESLIFSLKQIFRPFFIYSEPILGLWVTIFATLQTIMHLVLVTMLVFSVRRRLSIK